ncbi:hypothetical protein DPMN_090416 [Dreissena polymorpha]|uniref:Uncharacterized protein n=1 Tax=Dreissena polymorpha TaxID=45954 RepID=A0A9D4QYA9_DREPO|nr:hypothetical protein DPMN_090416 [Dreissena polymorpha]
MIGQSLNTAPHPGGHLYEDWASNVTSTVFISFELSRGINRINPPTKDTNGWICQNKIYVLINVLTKFHEDQTINVASGVFTRQNTNIHGVGVGTGDGLGKKDWAINVASIVLTRQKPRTHKG